MLFIPSGLSVLVNNVVQFAKKLGSTDLIVLLPHRNKSDVRIIRVAKKAFDWLGKILKHRKRKVPIRFSVLQCYVHLLTSTLIYVCECWIMSSKMEKKFEAAEMWFLRRILRIFWTDCVTNKEVLSSYKKEGRTGRIAVKTIQRRAFESSGHVVCKERF